MGLLLLLACVVGISFYLFAASFVLLGTLAPHSGVTLFLVLNALVFVYMAEKSIFAERKERLGVICIKAALASFVVFAVSSMIYIYGAEGAKHGLNAFWQALRESLLLSVVNSICFVALSGLTILGLRLFYGSGQEDNEEQN